MNQLGDEEIIQHFAGLSYGFI